MQKMTPKPTSPCEVILADDQAIFRAGVARVLNAQSDISTLAQCDSLEKLREAVSAAAKHCVVIIAQSLDPELDRMFSAVETAGARVILMSEMGASLPPPVLRRLHGRLTRQISADELLSCVRRVHKGERVLTGSTSSDTLGDRMRDQLSPRELQIIGFVVQGCKNRRIAEEIGTSEQVVKNYLRSIYDKTGASDRLELALFTLHHRPLAEAASRAVEMFPNRTACA